MLVAPSPIRFRRATRRGWRSSIPGGYAHRFDGIGRIARATRPAEDLWENSRLAQLRAEEETAGSLLIEGTSNCPTFIPGFQFNLKDHGHGDGAYRLTRVEHEAKVTSYRSGQDESASYDNHFACIPADVPYRPARKTPRPVLGLQTATVVGPAGEESFTDKYGRVKVQFNWDRQGKRNADSSCWVRCSGLGKQGLEHGQHPRWPGGGVVSLKAIPIGHGRQRLQRRSGAPFDLPALAPVQGLKAQTYGATATQRARRLGIETQTGKEHVYVHANSTAPTAAIAATRCAWAEYNVHVGDFTRASSVSSRRSRKTVAPHRRRLGSGTGSIGDSIVTSSEASPRPGAERHSRLRKRQRLRPIHLLCNQSIALFLQAPEGTLGGIRHHELRSGDDRRALRCHLRCSDRHLSRPQVRYRRVPANTR